MLALVHISSRYDVRAVLGEAREEFGERDRAARLRPRRDPVPRARHSATDRKRSSAPARGDRGAAGVTLDEHLARHLHVESLRHRDLHPEHEPHVLFQASTIGALLEGAFEGDVTFDELAEHGDLGLGTLNGLDGEMIAIDGGFYRADVDGYCEPIAPEARTPFAALAWFEPSFETELEARSSYADLLADLDRVAADPESSCALRIDGEFERILARSVPRQLPPYQTLTEVVADQHVFELTEVEGTVVGFRFPDYARGLEARGLSPALHHRRPRARRARAWTAGRARSPQRSTSRASCTSSCRPGSSSTRQSSTTRPRRRWRGPRVSASRAGRPGRRSRRRAARLDPPGGSAWPAAGSHPRRRAPA